MLSLPQPNKAILDEYYKIIIKKINNQLDKQDFVFLKNSISEQVIKELILGDPEAILHKSNALMNQIFNNFNQDEFESYLVIKTKKNRNLVEEQLYNKYSNEKYLIKAFNYDQFISKSKSTGYHLALRLNRNTCTYCNRLYTLTVVKKPLKNNDDRIIRPQFDHWYSKKKHPLLALSFFNLIPSCSVCNTQIKLDSKFNLVTHYHPYKDNFIDKFTFSYNQKQIDEYEVKINPISYDLHERGKINTTLEAFKIKEIYNAHSSLELKDLIDLKMKYQKDYLEKLFNGTFNGLYVSEKEMYRLVFGIENESDNYYKRPFSKFKKDIISELRKIDK